MATRRSGPPGLRPHSFGSQDGRDMRFYSDLLQGKVVVISTMFATCTGACPVMGRTLAKVQTWLGERLGRDVHLISITVDPENDTPERLKALGETFGARPGWYFLTGEKANVEFALYKLGQRVENKEGHQSILLIGNEPTGLWKKAFGLSQAEAIIQIVDSVLNDQGPAS
jgi:protein SCO1/2